MEYYCQPLTIDAYTQWNSGSSGSIDTLNFQVSAHLAVFRISPPIVPTVERKAKGDMR